MKRIAIDMDGVLADTTAQFLQYHERETGIRLAAAAIMGKTESIAFPNVYKWVNTEGFFRHLPVMENAQEVVQRLNERYEIFIVSAATEFPNSLIDKQAWLKEHFPFISWKNIVFCGSKTIIQADIMIDDHFKNLDYFKGETLLFTASHNAFADNGRHRRVDTWLEIEKILLI
jgi:5'-nucleotidase